MSESSITSLLEAWRRGDREAEDALMARVYPMLREIASVQLRRAEGRITLRTTDLAHEAYERLRKQERVDWQNRSHFYAIAATVMRRFIVDYLRQRGADKRGGELEIVSLDAELHGEVPQPEQVIDWLSLDQAMTRLAEKDAAMAKVIELRVFSGLGIDEIAELMASSTATVGRQLRFARVWLAEQMGNPGQLHAHD
jgi:RNA polymerase sigma factor (TIGR02999 family)